MYLFPACRPSFDVLYGNVPAQKKNSLLSFRSEYRPRRLVVDGLEWEYLATGSGKQTLLLLHGMAGSYDIWWQQILDLKDKMRIISVTYPAAKSLGDMEKGVLAILDREEIGAFCVSGTSLGGYCAQYLVARHPGRIQRAIFANTFPPNDLILAKNGKVGRLIPFLPARLVMGTMRKSYASSIYPASRNDELTLAFLNEISYWKMNKRQVAMRYRCVVEKFEAPINAKIPLLIIEASNDPLVGPALRSQLKAAYPTARVVTVENGHFPYLSNPDDYTQQIRQFILGD